MLACRIGLQRGESCTKAACIHVAIRVAPQQGLPVYMCPPDRVTSGLASDFVHFDARCSCASLLSCSRAAKLRSLLGLLRSASCTRHHADSFCRRVTRVSSVNAAVGSLVRDSIQTSGVPTSLRMSPARTRICQRLRRALIRSQLPPVLNERFRALAVRTHSLSQVAMRPLAAPRVIRAVRATGRRA